MMSWAMGRVLGASLPGAVALGAALLGGAAPPMGGAAAEEQANGVTLEAPSGWGRSQEGPNVVYRNDACSLSVLAPRPLDGSRPVPFFQETWSSVKGALQVLREQPPAQMRTGDGSIGRFASAVVDSGVDERVISVFMASDARNAHFLVFTGPVPPCEGQLPQVERAMRSVALGDRRTLPERM